MIQSFIRDLLYFTETESNIKSQYKKQKFQIHLLIVHCIVANASQPIPWNLCLASAEIKNILWIAFSCFSYLPYSLFLFF